MKARAWSLTAAVTLLGVVFGPMAEPVFAQGSSGIVISEYRLRGPAGQNDEFIELFNAGATDLDVSGWRIRSSNNGNPPVTATLVTMPAGTTIRRGCFYLVANVTASGGFSGGVTPDRTFSSANAFFDNSGVALFTAAPVIIDQVGNGTSPTAYGERTRLPAFVASMVNQSYERKPGGAIGYVDSDNNAADFQMISPATPRNSAAANCVTPAPLTVTSLVSPMTIEQGQSATLQVTVSTATFPPSTGLEVLGDLSAIGGSAAVVFADDGVAPDAVANDHIFTASVSVPYFVSIGSHAITISAVDEQGRSASTTISAGVVPPAALFLPHDVQGAGAVSPLPVGSLATVRGVVTARTANGFFLQTEAGSEDGDPQTSEGLFVRATGPVPATAAVGRLVQVTAHVGEFTPSADPASPSTTELNGILAVLDLGPSTLPDAIALTSAELTAAGPLDQLERFEGMRVTVASLTAISGTDSNGVFHAVITGQPRPFREPGIEAGHALLVCASGSPCTVPLFDGNPHPCCS